MSDRCRLRELNLYENKIGDEGAKALAEALQENQTLTSLVLWDNKIGDEGGKALLEALQKNQTLTTIYLSDNPMSSSLQGSIRAKARANQS